MLGVRKGLRGGEEGGEEGASTGRVRKLMRDGRGNIF